MFELLNCLSCSYIHCLHVYLRGCMCCCLCNAFIYLVTVHLLCVRFWCPVWRVIVFGSWHLRRRRLQLWPSLQWTVLPIPRWDHKESLSHNALPYLVMWPYYHTRQSVHTRQGQKPLFTVRTALCAARQAVVWCMQNPGCPQFLLRDCT